MNNTSEPQTQSTKGRLSESVINAEKHLAQVKQLAELAEIAKPIQAFLQKHFDLHTTIAVGWNNVCACQIIRFTELED